MVASGRKDNSKALRRTGQKARSVDSERQSDLGTFELFRSTQPENAIFELRSAGAENKAQELNFFGVGGVECCVCWHSVATWKLQALQDRG
jgi:hypothetical protein